jgi:hypothetical protein
MAYASDLLILHEQGFSSLIEEKLRPNLSQNAILVRK